MILMALLKLVKKNPHIHNEPKLTGFECGFEPLTAIRQPFSIRFFILVVLFLVFDVESVLLFPCLSNITSHTPYASGLSLYLFAIILFGGLLYEWYNSMLEWV
nr:NADH dehydrogenase subunit 3 [Levantina rechingeri]